MEELKSLLYVFSFIIFFLFFYLFRTRVVDPRWNEELRSLYIKFHLCLNSSGIWKFFLNSFYLVLLTVSMNLFDQLVIDICDLVME